MRYAAYVASMIVMFLGLVALLPSTLMLIDIAAAGEPFRAELLQVLLLAAIVAAAFLIQRKFVPPKKTKGASQAGAEQ